MRSSIRILSLVCVLFLVALPLFAQVPPCRPGTMASVIGTSCSVGPMIFNFQNDFQGGQTTPADIGFIPVQSDNQAGFKLVLNFNDSPGAPFGFSGHLLQFTYTPQAAPENEIRVQSVSMDATVQGSPADIAFAQIFDFQFYPNSGFLATDTSFDIEQGVTLSDQLSNSVILEVPGLLSTGPGPFGFKTTQIANIATGTASASMPSATFLYTTGPIVPAPGPAPLAYKSIDLPGVPATFVSNITNSGRTVGTIQDSAGVFHAYVAEADGVTFTTIDFPGALRTFGGGLNERGDVVGEYTDSARHNHGFSLIDGVFSTIDVPNSRFTTAVTINDKRQIVGEFESRDRGFHGFLLEDGVFTIIDHGPGTGIFASSAAVGINNSGEIGGFFFDPNTFRGYTQKQGSFQPVDVPGQGDAIIEAINNPGDFVGTFNDINLGPHGFLQSQGRFFTVDFPGGSNNFALGINAAGQIVGQYSDANGLSHSYLAVPSEVDNSNNQGAAAAQSDSSARPNCNQEDWQQGHAERHHLVACTATR
jgi:hypothetical protein